MPEMIKVHAVEGRLLPYDRKMGHVGYREAKEGETPEHVIPRARVAGKNADVRLVRAGVVEVPDTAYYRRAIARGDLERESDQAPVAVQAASETAEEPSMVEQPAPTGAAESEG